MKKLYINFLLVFAIISISSCLEDEMPELDPCADGEWGKVERDGDGICFPNATASYYEANTANSSFKVQLGTFGTASAISLSAQFLVPASGLELNKAYTLSDGDFFGTENLVSGEMTILNYEFNNDGTYCTSGTFSMITENPNSGSQTILTNGKFLYQRGISDCNPF